MRLGYGTYVAAGPRAAELLRWELGAAEAAGFDAVFFSEHHGRSDYPPSPMALSAWALGQSETLKAGPLPLLLPLHDAVRVAEETALLDSVSGGRLIVGVATGWERSEFEQAGVVYERRGPIVDEGVRMIASLWRGERVPRDGGLPDVEPLAHPPATPGGPPLWIAAASKPGMRRALNWGGGLALDSLRSAREVESILSRFRDMAAERGVSPGTTAVIRRLWLGSKEEVRAFLTKFRDDARRYEQSAHGATLPWMADLVRDGFSDEAIRQRVWVGEPEDVGEGLAAWCQEAGVDYVIAKFHWGDFEQQAIVKQLELARRLIARVGQIAGEG